MSESDATVLSLLGSVVRTASGSAGTEASELAASAILFRLNLLRLMGYNKGIELTLKTVDEDPASCKRWISRKEIKSAKI